MAPTAMPAGDSSCSGGSDPAKALGAHEPNAAAFDLHELIGFLIRRTQQAHVAAWQREVSTDITSVQFGVMNVLRDRPGASQRELCDALDLDRSTIADIVARLQRRGLIDRVRDAADKRRNMLELTEVGRGEFDSLVPGVRRVDAVLTSGLQDSDRTTLRRILHDLLDSAQVRRPAAGSVNQTAENDEGES